MRKIVNKSICVNTFFEQILASLYLDVF